MNIDQTAKKIHKHLITRAIRGDFDGTDVTGFDMSGIKKILKSAIKKEERDHPEASGFSVEDVLHQAKEDGVKLTRTEAKEVIQFINRKNEAPVDWDVISDFIRRYKDEK